MDWAIQVLSWPMSGENSTQISFKYTFKMSDSKSFDFEILLDSKTLTYQTVNSGARPDWTDLSYHMCENCALADSGLPACPVAINLQDIVTTFRSVVSYDLVDISIMTEDRTYSKNKVSMQSGLSSILGIIMVTSGCPSLDYLRPMVKSHLPFATINESIYRAMSMYLLAQFTRVKHGLDPDWSLKGLTDIYTRIDSINISMVKRLQAATEEDASLNAVVILDSFAKMVPMSIEGNIGGLDTLFWPYLKDAAESEPS